MPTVVPSVPFPTDDTFLSSGTVGNTVIDTIMVIESAARRCGKEPTSLTAEQLEAARNSLYYQLSALSNRGLNLWSLDEIHLPLETGRINYPLPVGTESIVSGANRRISRIAPAAQVFTGLANCSLTLPSIQPVKFFGFKLAADFSGTLEVETSSDGILWQSAFVYTDVALVHGWQWLTFDPAPAALCVRVRDTADRNLTVLDMVAGDEYTDRPLGRYNRDDYMQMVNKSMPGHPLNFYFEKKIGPVLKLWPVPSEDDELVVLWIQRRLQDVGELYQKLEVPERWFESVVWTLAKTLAFELPGVTPERIQLCIDQAAGALEDAELGESDGTPIRIAPNIGGYTR